MEVCSRCNEMKMAAISQIKSLLKGGTRRRTSQLPFYLSRFLGGRYRDEVEVANVDRATRVKWWGDALFVMMIVRLKE